MKKIKCSIYIVLYTFFVCCTNKQAIKIKGSDTEVNLVVRLAEDFHKVDAKFNVSISGGGSGLGIASLLNGQADIANSSRALNAFEVNLFKKRGIDITTIIFAEDAIAFVVAKDFPLDSIHAEELAKILSGAYNNWSAITTINLPINIYGRQSNSGTHDFVKQTLNIEFSRKAKEMNGNAQIIEAVKADHSGIGYVGAGYVMSGTASNKQAVKVLKIAATKKEQAISPFDEQAISNNKYLFQRPLYQFIRAESIAKVSSFIDFEKSAQGLAVIKASGYYPISNQRN